VRRDSDHHSNGFRGFLSTFMRISKYLLKRTKIVSLFLQMLEHMMQAISDVSLTVVKFYCVVSFMHIRIYGYASAVFVQVNGIKIIHYGQ
jgi:hypothetical protein